jgi:hypothetical protein
MDLVKTYIDYDKIFERELLKKLEDFYGAWKVFLFLVG